MSTACGTQSPGCPPPACPQKPRLGDGAPPAHLVGVLQVEPGVEGARGQVQVGELELGHAGADAPLVLVDAEDGEAQAVLLQRRRIQRHREALIEGHGVGAPLDLPRGAGIALAPTGRGAASLRCPIPWEVRRHPQGTPHPIGMICSRPDHGSCSATGVKIGAVACPSARRYIPPPQEHGCASGLAVSGGRIYGYQVKPPALLQAEPAPECAQWEWCCLADVVPVSRHSLGAEAAAAPAAHPAGADPEKLAEGNCSEVVDLGVVFSPYSSPVSASKMPHTNQWFVPWDGKLQPWIVWSKADPPAPQSHPNPGGEETPLWGCVTPKPPGRGFISPKDSLLSQPAPNPAPSLGWRTQRWHLP